MKNSFLEISGDSDDYLNMVIKSILINHNTDKYLYLILCLKN